GATLPLTTPRWPMWELIRRIGLSRRCAKFKRNGATNHESAIGGTCFGRHNSDFGGIRKKRRCPLGGSAHRYSCHNGQGRRGGAPAHRARLEATRSVAHTGCADR